MRRLDRAAAVLRQAGHGLTLIPTTGPGTAGDIARRAIDAGSDLILVAGGDGTVNEAISGMVHAETPLAVLPAGTANVLASELGLGASMERVAGRIGEFQPRRVALGRLHACGAAPRHFLLMAGSGVDAGIVHGLSPGLKTRFGKLAYWVGGFQRLARGFPEFEVMVEGRRLRSSFALASRVRNYGGNFEIARRVSLLDDYFELVSFEGSSAVRYLKYFAGFLFRRLDGMKGAAFLTTREVELVPPPGVRIHVQVDGEYAGELPARVEIVPDALTLLVPVSYVLRAGDGSGRTHP